MSRVVRSAVKRLAQKILGESDVRGFARKRKLWLSKKVYRQPVAIADLRQRMKARVGGTDNTPITAKTVSFDQKNAL